MPIAWFIAPYKRHPHPVRARRYCALDDFTPDIQADDGDWSEAEIDGDMAIVKVRAAAPTLARIAGGSDVPFARVDDPAPFWTPTRAKPINRAGEIAFDSGVWHECRSLDNLNALLLNDADYGDLRRRADDLARRADREGYIRLTGYPWSIAAQLLVLLARMGYGLDRVSTGTFPTTGVLDDFNRGDSSTLGANWTADTFNFGETSPNVASNQAASGVAGYDTAHWNPATFGPDSEVYADVATPGATDDELVLFLRAASVNTNSVDCYMVTLIEAAADAIVIYRMDNQTPTQLGSTINQEIDAGDGLGLEAIGPSIAVYRRVSGSWSILDSPRTDATYGAAGNIGLAINDTVLRIDNFGGGTLVPTLEQEGFRFRADDGSESGASWLATQDVNISRAISLNTRLRVLANATSDPASQALALQWRRVGDPAGEWRNV